jgi:predicted nucleic acid-binding Zn ribbon protein
VTRFDEEPEDTHGECRAEIKRLSECLELWEEKEAAVCPEDVGVWEYIRDLTYERDAALARCEALEAGCRAICDHVARVGNGSGHYWYANYASALLIRASREGGKYEQI